jgi:hypothetical protein
LERPARVLAFEAKPAIALTQARLRIDPRHGCPFFRESAQPRQQPVDNTTELATHHSDVHQSVQCISGRIIGIDADVGALANRFQGDAKRVVLNIFAKPNVSSRSA